MRLSRVLLILLGFLAVSSAGLGAGLTRSAPAEAQSAVWSTDLLVNGDFDSGQSPWELASLWTATGSFVPAVQTIDGVQALRQRLVVDNSDQCGSMVAVGAQEWFDIDPQDLNHDLRLRFRLRMDGAASGQAGVGIRVFGQLAGGTPADAPRLYTTTNFDTQRHDTTFVDLTGGAWVEGLLEFRLVNSQAVEALRIEVEPVLRTSTSICDSNTVTSYLDWLALESRIVATPGGARPFPRLADLPDEGTAGATQLVNAYRDLAGVPLLAYESAASGGARNHAHYMAINNGGTGGHWEDPAVSGYTQSGDDAARASRLCEGSASLAECAESLIAVPYHRFDMLTADSGFDRYGLTLGFEDVYGVLGILDADVNGDPAANLRYFTARDAAQTNWTPNIWPAGGVSGVPHALTIMEAPDPLFLCAGAPADRTTGYPITVEFPFAIQGDAVSNGQGTLRNGSGQTVPLCRIDAQIPHPQHIAILPPGSTSSGAPGKFIFLPLSPLAQGETYTFTFTGAANGVAGSWSTMFSTRGALPLRADTDPGGTATPPVPAEGQRLVALARGWNLVGWTGNTAVTDATASISGTFDALFTWDAATQSFRTFRPADPPFLNNLSALQLGDGVWIHVTRSTVFWSQPAVTAARGVNLRTGFNLVLWTGPDGTPTAGALGGLGSALKVLYRWNAGRQGFEVYNPSQPAFLNDATVLNHGDGVWVQMHRAATWSQPAP